MNSPARKTAGASQAGHAVGLTTRAEGRARGEFGTWRSHGSEGADERCYFETALHLAIGGRVQARPKEPDTLILDKLRRDGQVVAKLLSQELGLSEDTIRKDLRELAQEGRLLRVHGGALPASPAVADYAGRQQLATAGKIAIGRAAATIFLPQRYRSRA